MMMLARYPLPVYYSQVKFGCPRQIGNPFFSAQLVFFIFKLFLVPNVLNEHFRFLNFFFSILSYFSVTFLT